MIARYCKPMGVAVAALVPLLTSCASAPTRLFTVATAAPNSISSSYDGPPIRIETVHIPPALDRIEILSEVGPGEFKVSDRDHWVAPLGQLARQALTADLIARLPQGRVIFPDLAKPTGAISVSVDVLAFGADREGATLQASWVGTSDASEPRACGGTVLLQTAAPVAGSAAIASALSALLAQLADRIAEQLPLSAPMEPTS